MVLHISAIKCHKISYHNYKVHEKIFEGYSRRRYWPQIDPILLQRLKILI